MRVRVSLYMGSMCVKRGPEASVTHTQHQFSLFLRPISPPVYFNSFRVLLRRLDPQKGKEEPHVSSPARHGTPASRRGGENVPGPCPFKLQIRDVSVYLYGFVLLLAKIFQREKPTSIRGYSLHHQQSHTQQRERDMPDTC